MAKKSGNGHKGNGKDPVVTALHELTAEVRGMREELTGLRTDTNARFGSLEQVLRGHGRQLEALHEGLADLRGELHEGFIDLGSKIVSAVERDRRLESDVRGLGERVARIEARLPETR